MSHKTHRHRLARLLADAKGIPYQRALDIVVQAAEAGNLPRTLDSDGMARALSILTEAGPTARSSEAPSTASIPFATDADGDPVVLDPVVSPHLLVTGSAGSGKSVALQQIVTGALTGGWDVYVADPFKGGSDLRVAAPSCRMFAGDLADALALLVTVDAEVTRRHDLLQDQGRRLSDRQRGWGRLLVVVEEVGALLGQGSADHADSEDATAASDLLGRIARRGAPAGVTLVLATQVPRNVDLEQALGEDWMRTSGRLVMGRVSPSHRWAALRRPEHAPELPDTAARGAGLFEDGSHHAMPVQVQYLSLDELMRRLVEAGPVHMDPATAVIASATDGAASPRALMAGASGSGKTVRPEPRKAMVTSLMLDLAHRGDPDARIVLRPGELASIQHSPDGYVLPNTAFGVLTADDVRGAALALSGPTNPGDGPHGERDGEILYRLRGTQHEFGCRLARTHAGVEVIIRLLPDAA